MWLRRPIINRLNHNGGRERNVRQTDIQADRQTGRRERANERREGKHKGRKTDRQTDRNRTCRHTLDSIQCFLHERSRKKGRQTDRQTDRQACMHSWPFAFTSVATDKLQNQPGFTQTAKPRRLQPAATRCNPVPTPVPNGSRKTKAVSVVRPLVGCCRASP